MEGLTRGERKKKEKLDSIDGEIEEIGMHKISAMHYTILHCTVLHYTALHCTTLHYTALHTSVLRADVLRMEEEIFPQFRKLWNPTLIDERLLIIIVSEQI